mgnify:CR=1 FL=1
MKDSIKPLKEDVAFIMRRHYERMEDVYAQTQRELEALITKAYFDGIDEGVESMINRLKKGEAA